MSFKQRYKLSPPSILIPKNNSPRSHRSSCFSKFDSVDESSLSSSYGSTFHSHFLNGHQDEHIVTPFAQVLSCLKSVRQYIVTSNLPNDKSKRDSIIENPLNSMESNPIGIETSNDHNGVIFSLSSPTVVSKDESKLQHYFDALEALDWALSQLEIMQSHKSIFEMASAKFKKMLNKELSQYAEHNKSDNQIAEFICNTYLEKGAELEMPNTNEESASTNLPTKTKMTISDLNLNNGNCQDTNALKESYDNLNENFFSKPINPIDSNKDTETGSISTLTQTENSPVKNNLPDNSVQKLAPLTPSNSFQQETNEPLRNDIRAGSNLTPTNSNSNIAGNLKATNINISLVPTMNKIFIIKPQFNESLTTEGTKSALSSDANNNNINNSEIIQNELPKYGIKSDLKNELELDKVMNDIDLWGIDIFLIDQLSHNRPLTAVAYTIFQKRDFINKFQICPHMLINFFTTLEDHYQLVPFHNKIHAADVTQSIHVLLNTKALESVFTDLEIFAAVLSAAVHDVDHPGLTNQYLINKGSELAIMYNDDSVLENHHLAVAFKILQNESCDILVNFNKKQRQVIRKMVIDMVLATDMSKHMSLLAELKTMAETKKLSSSGFIVLDGYQDRIRVLQNMLHCSDLSNPTKPLPIYQSWTDRLMNEFFQQGDRELSEGLEISPMCDRHNASIEKSQVGFIDFIVHPLWESWSDLVAPDAQDVLDTLEQNRNWYCVQVDKLNAQSSSNDSIKKTDET